MAYESFLLEYPNSALSHDARKKIWKLAFEEARQNDTVQAYEEYLMQYDDPINIFTSKAKDRIIELEFELARQANSITAYEDFINKFPKSKIKWKAELGIVELAYNKAKLIDTLESYEEYLKKYKYVAGASVYTFKAKSRIAEITFESAPPITDIEMAEIINEVKELIHPFKLSDLYDKSMTTWKQPNSNQTLQMNTSYEGEVRVSIIATHEGSIVSKRQPIPGMGSMVVVLQARPAIGELGVFYEINEKSGDGYKIRIHDPQKEHMGGLKFSKIDIDNYKGRGQPLSITCRQDKCIESSKLTGETQEQIKTFID